MKKYIQQIIVLLSVLLPFSASAQRSMMQPSEGDSIQVWLLTCDPGPEVYEYYGHTALGFINCTQEDSIVVHYGVFDFNVPNFALRFILGQTDYTSAACPWSMFVDNYLHKGIAITAQRLLLSSKAAQKLYQSVYSDCTTPGWTYRYNFAYDNCATRIRDKVRSCAEYEFFNAKTDEEPRTIRDILHEYCKGDKWTTFGQDLLIGAEADREASRSVQEFAPLYLAKHFEKDVLVFKSNKGYLFVRDVKFYDPEKPAVMKADCPVSPMVCTIALLILTLLICVWDIRRKKMAWGYDMLLLFAEGLAGCLISFMFFCSEHPTLDSNWLVAFYNPLPLIGMIEVMARERKGKQSRFLTWWGAFVMVFILLIPIIPQKISTEFILLALCLPLRSLCGVIVEHKKRLQKH